MALVLHETIAQVGREVAAVALAHILVQTLALPAILPVKVECRLVITLVVGVHLFVTLAFRGRVAEVDSKFAVVHIVQADKALVLGLALAHTTVVAVVFLLRIIFVQIVIQDVTAIALASQIVMALVFLVNNAMALPFMVQYVIPVTLVLLVMQTVMPVVTVLVMAIVTVTVMADAIQVVLHTTALVPQLVMYAITASPAIVVAILIVIQGVMIARVVTALVIQNVMTNAKVG